MALLSAETHSLISVIKRLFLIDCMHQSQSEEELLTGLQKQQKAIAVLSNILYLLYMYIIVMLFIYFDIFKLLVSSACTRKAVFSVLDVSVLLKFIEDLLMHNQLIDGVHQHRHKEQRLHIQCNIIL